MKSKRDVVIGEVEQESAKDTNLNQWVFDTGTNAHITFSKEYLTTLQEKTDNE